MLEILLRDVSTRQYRPVLPAMAETMGVSRSSVNREATEASEQELQWLCGRRFDEVELLAIYLDGVIFGEHHVLVALFHQWIQNLSINSVVTLAFETGSGSGSKSRKPS